jgi:hypothetical protein
MSQPNDRERRSVGTTLGAIALIVIGLLVLVPSGLCTSVFGYNAISSYISNPSQSDIGLLAIALVLGLPFVAIGAVIVRAGVRIWRDK